MNEQTKNIVTEQKYKICTSLSSLSLLDQFCTKTLPLLHKLQREYKEVTERFSAIESSHEKYYFSGIKKLADCYELIIIQFNQYCEVLEIPDLGKCILKIYIQLMSIFKCVFKSMHQKQKKCDFYDQKQIRKGSANGNFLQNSAEYHPISKIQKIEKSEFPQQFYVKKQRTKFFANQIYNQIVEAQVKYSHQFDKKIEDQLKQSKEQIFKIQSSRADQIISQAQSLLANRQQSLDNFIQLRCMTLNSENKMKDSKNIIDNILNQQKNVHQAKIQQARERLTRLFQQYQKKKFQEIKSKMVSNHCQTQQQFEIKVQKPVENSLQKFLKDQVKSLSQQIKTEEQKYKSLQRLLKQRIDSYESKIFQGQMNNHKILKKLEEQEIKSLNLLKDLKKMKEEKQKQKQKKLVPITDQQQQKFQIQNHQQKNNQLASQQSQLFEFKNKNQKAMKQINRKRMLERKANYRISKPKISNSEENEESGFLSNISKNLLIKQLKRYSHCSEIQRISSLLSDNDTITEYVQRKEIGLQADFHCQVKQQVTIQPKFEQRFKVLETSLKLQKKIVSLTIDPEVEKRILRQSSNFMGKHDKDKLEKKVKMQQKSWNLDINNQGQIAYKQEYDKKNNQRLSLQNLSKQTKEKKVQNSFKSFLKRRSHSIVKNQKQKNTENLYIQSKQYQGSSKYVQQCLKSKEIFLQKKIQDSKFKFKIPDKVIFTNNDLEKLFMNPQQAYQFQIASLTLGAFKKSCHVPMSENKRSIHTFFNKNRQQTIQDQSFMKIDCKSGIKKISFIMQKKEIQQTTSLIFKHLSTIKWSEGGKIYQKIRNFIRFPYFTVGWAQKRLSKNQPQVKKSNYQYISKEHWIKMLKNQDDITPSDIKKFLSRLFKIHEKCPKQLQFNKEQYEIQGSKDEQTSLFCVHIENFLEKIGITILPNKAHL